MPPYWSLLCSIGAWWIHLGYTNWFSQLSPAAAHEYNPNTVVPPGASHHIKGTSPVAYQWYGIAVSVLSSWVFGYGIAHGSSKNGFISFGYPLFSGASGTDWDPILTYISYSTLGAAFITGTVLDRMGLVAWGAYSLILNIFIHPVAEHWISNGWLTNIQGLYSAVDCGAASYINLIYGTCAACLSYVLGYDESLSRFSAIAGGGISSLLYIVVGWILWNANGYYSIAPLVAVNTTLAMAAAALVVQCVDVLHNRILRIDAMAIGLVAGLISLNASYANVLPWEAFIIGGLGGATFYYFDYAMRANVPINDPFKTISLNVGCGAWAVIAAGLFGKDIGFFYGHYRQLGIQLLTVIIMIVWASCWTMSFGLMFRRFTLLTNPNWSLKYGLEIKPDGQLPTVNSNRNRVMPLQGVLATMDDEPASRSFDSFTRGSTNGANMSVNVRSASNYMRPRQQSLQHGLKRFVFSHKSVSIPKNIEEFDEMCTPANLELVSEDVARDVNELHVERRYMSSLVVYEGAITLPSSGKYEFGLNSDCPIELFIDGDMVAYSYDIYSIVAQDKPYGICGTKDLGAGEHHIMVRVFTNETGAATIRAFWKGMHTVHRWTPIPPSALTIQGNEKEKETKETLRSVGSVATSALLKRSETRKGHNVTLAA